MYINQINDLFNTLLDSFNQKIIKNDFMKTILADVNFVKYQFKILIFIEEFVNNDMKIKIKEITQTDTFSLILLNLIKRYCAFYIYLAIAYHYKGNHSLFITNLVETSKYQKDSTIQIDKFFNSESNSKIIQYFYDIKNLLSLFEFKSIDKIKILLGNNPLKYESTIRIFNELGEDYIVDNFLIENNMLNILKTLIFRFIYLTEDKDELIKLIEHKDKDDAEYKYIEIIVSNKMKRIDYIAIQNILTIQQLKSGYAEELYDYIHEFSLISDLNTDDTFSGLKYLFNKRVVIPITEDYLRYHKDTEKYEENITDRTKDKDSTKIKYIISKINNITNFYSPLLLNNAKLKLETQNLFYKQLENRKAVLYNDSEELRIMSKLELSREAKDADFIIDLQNMRKYAYLNFKDFSRNGFKLRVPNTINCIRYTSIQDTKTNLLETRIGHDNIDMNIIGIAFNPASLILDCVEKNNLIDVRKEYNNENGYLSFVKTLIRRNQKIYYWLFNNNDVPVLDKYVDININDAKNNIKVMIEQIYIEYINVIKKRFCNHIDKITELDITELHTLLEKYNVNDLQSKDTSELISYAIYNKLIEQPIIYDIALIDKKDIIKLPILENKIKHENITKLGFTEIDVSLELSGKIIPLCHHYIKWSQINKQSKNPEINQIIFNFVKQYVKINEVNEYACKSCNELLYLQKYVVEGTYVEELDEFLTTSLVVTERFEDNPIYSKYIKVIKNIEKNIEKIAHSIDLIYYVGNQQNTRLHRKTLIKDIIDIILLHTEWGKKQPETRRSEYVKKYNTSLSNLFFFELKDDIFLTSSADTDKYKILKYNTILAYMVFIIITTLNYGQIISLKEHKKYNYFIYSKVGTQLFTGLFLRKNQKDKIPLINIPILSFILYYFSGVLLENRIWLWTGDDKDPKNVINVQKTIIHTIIDLMNTICEVNFEPTKNYLYEIINTRFFNDKLKHTYGDEKLLKQLNDNAMKYIKIDSTTNKITFVTKKVPMVDLNMEYKTQDKPIKHCKYTIKEIDKNKQNVNDNNDINILTNCANGKFHEWVYKNNDLICSICNQSYNSLVKTLNETTEKQTTEEKTDYIYILKLISLKNLANKYCISGELHDIHDDVCNKCKVNIKTVKYTDKELLQLEKNITKKNYEEILEQINKYKQIQEEQKLIDDKTKIIMTKFIKNYEKLTKGKLYGYIDDFIDRLDKSIGSKIGNIYLRDTVYTIDHDALGNYLNQPVTILSSTNRLQVKNHKSFNKDILYYKNNNIYVYYDIITCQYLGYSDDDKNIRKTNNIRSLKITQSLRDMLYMLGYENKYLNLYHLNKEYNKDNKILNNQDIETIIRERSNNLRHVIIRTQSIIYGIINKMQITNIYNNDEKKLVTEFNTKIKSINTRNESKHKNIFKHYTYIINKLKFKQIPQNFNIKTLRNYVDITNINELNNIDNYLLFYFVYNLNRVLDYNTQKEITVLVIKIIEYLHNLYHVPYTNFHIQKFDTLLFIDTPFIDDTLKPSGYYQDLLTQDEIDDPEQKEANYDEQEAKDSLDIDDYEMNDDEDGAVVTLHGDDD
jgi:hypothetical protein